MPEWIVGIKKDADRCGRVSILRTTSLGSCRPSHWCCRFVGRRWRLPTPGRTATREGPEPARAAKTSSAISRTGSRARSALTDIGNRELQIVLQRRTLDDLPACSCTDGGTPCEECEQRAMQRRPESGAAAATAPSSRTASDAVRRVLGMTGVPLSGIQRQAMEHRLGHDFSDVRVHTDAAAADAALAVRAEAFTVGRRVVFGANRFTDDAAGRSLLAHELTHVVQQRRPGGLDPSKDAQTRYEAEAEAAGAGGGRPPRSTDVEPTDLPVQRAALDPENRLAWAVVMNHRESRPEDFLDTLSAAPAAKLALGAQIEKAPVPANDQDRDALVSQIRRYIRLMALGLMAAHRATIENKRDAMKPPDKASKGETAVNVYVIRQAAAKIRTLQDEKEQLVHSRSVLERDQLAVVRGDAFMDVITRLFTNSQLEMSPRIRGVWSSVFGNLASKSSIDHGIASALAFNLSQTLVKWRDGQINGVDAALAYIYDVFPVFSHLDAADILAAGQGQTAVDVMAKVQAAYRELIDAIDVAIGKIGSGDIDPFDMPQAVKMAREELPPALRPVLDAAKEHHEVLKFWTSMGLTLAQVLLVFVPVVGPFIAAGIGVAMLADQVEDVLNKRALGEASSAPTKEMLGVSSPGKLEWMMLAVNAALTIADLGGLAKSLHEGTVRFEPEAERPTVGGESEKPPVATENAQLESTRHVEGKLTDAQLEIEANAIKNAEHTSPTEPGYVDEVKLENDHIWRERADGSWCRFSGAPPKFCVIGGPQGPRTRMTTGLSTSHAAELEAIADELKAAGLNWSDIGLTSVEDVESILGKLTADEIETNLRNIRKRVEVETEFGSHQPDKPPPSEGLGVDKPAGTTDEWRAAPGKATGGTDLPAAQADWLYGAGNRRISRFPRQIADQMRGLHFKNFRQFRETFWKFVSEDPVLRTHFSRNNIEAMARGEAPTAIPSEHVGGGAANRAYNLNHIQPLEHGGALYDFDNIEIVTPYAHGELGKP